MNPDGRAAKRWAFLERLYAATDADVRMFVSAHEVAAALGIEHDDVGKILAYFEEKGYVKVDDYHSGVVRMTVQGVDAVEAGGG